MDQHVVTVCSQASMEGTMTFPEIVERLRVAGVQRYDVDLTSLRKTYYGADDTVIHKSLPLTDSPVVADGFSDEAVRAALIDSQQGRIVYPEFLRRIMAGGTASYTVFLDGRRAVYTGRHGDLYVEPFPSPK